MRREILVGIVVLIAINLIGCTLLRSSIRKEGAFAHYSLGVIHEQKGEREKAISSYKKAAKYDPTSSAIQIALSQNYLAIGKLDKALFHANRALELDKTSTPYFILGNIYLIRKDYNRAISAFQKVVELAPENIEAYYILATLFIQKRDYLSCISTYRRLIELTPGDPSLYFELGKLYLREDKIDLAIKEFQTILEMHPNSKQAHLLLGVCWEEKKEFEKAISCYKKVLEIDPGLDEVYYRLGVCYDSLGNFELTIESFRKVISLNPNHAEAYNYIGYLYAERGINLEESVRLVKKALEIEPENGYFIDSLGWAYYKQGRLDEALHQLKKAVKLVKDDPIIIEHLGDVYYANGMVKEAIISWERSLEVSSKEEERIRRKIREAEKGEIKNE